MRFQKREPVVELHVDGIFPQDGAGNCAINHFRRSEELFKVGAAFTGGSLTGRQLLGQCKKFFDRFPGEELSALFGIISLPKLERREDTGDFVRGHALHEDGLGLLKGLAVVFDGDAHDNFSSLLIKSKGVRIARLPLYRLMRRSSQVRK
jgi:hypothetical protein